LRESVPGVSQKETITHTRYVAIYISSYKGHFPEELDICVGKSFFRKAGMETGSPLVVHIFSGVIDPLAALHVVR
jgi:hypothetical protein